MYIKDGKIQPDGIHPEYIPTSIEASRWDDRTDLKWVHPDMKLFYDFRGENSIITSQIIDPGATREERVAKRDGHLAAFEAFVDPEVAGKINMETYTIPGLYEDDPEVEVFVLKPKDTKKKKHNVLFAFGMGVIAENSKPLCIATFGSYCLDLDIAVVYANTRTGTDVCFPKPLDEYQAAYQWVLDNGKELGLNTKNIVLCGQSGGGYTCLCFAFRCKRVGFNPKGALAIDPVMGDDFTYPSSRIITGYWDALDVQRTFKVVLPLGDQNSPFVSPEMVPSRATVEDCKGLCPIYIHTNELESCRDAAAAFAHKCLDARGFAEYHVWGGAPHSGTDHGNARIHKTFKILKNSQLQDMFEYDLRRPWVMEE